MTGGPRCPWIVPALLGLALAACSGSSVAPRRVVVIVLDSTHAAHLGSYGGPEGLTPNLDALAARGRRFARAVSNTTWTLPSTVSLMTGQLQETHGIVTNHHVVPDEAVLLAERFAAQGWATAAFVQMVYASEVHGLDQGFADWHRYQLTEGKRPERMLPDVARWMDDHADEPYLLYVHLRRPHSPYDPGPLHRARLEGDCPLADGRDDQVLAHADSRVHEPLDEVSRRHVEHLYRANLSQADDRLGEVLARAAADEELLVVVTADHGEALGQNGHYGHGYHLDPECIEIPLLAAGPGVLPGVDRGPASTVDLAPTLLELCGIPAGEAVDGRSLAPRLGGAPAEPRPVLLSGRYTRAASPAYGMLRGPLRVVLDREGALGVYDQAGAEVSGQHPELLAELGPRLQRRREDALGLAHTATSEGLDAEHEAELRALGYLR